MYPVAVGPKPQKQHDLSFAVVNGSERLSREGRREAPHKVLLKHKVGHVLLRYAEVTYLSVLRRCLSFLRASDTCICVPHCARRRRRLICFVDVPPLLTIYIVISLRTVQDGFPVFVMKS